VYMDNRKEEAGDKDEMVQGVEGETG